MKSIHLSNFLMDWVTSCNVSNLYYVNMFSDFPASIYSLKVDNRNTRTRYEICSKLTIKTSERRHWCFCGVLIVNVDHIPHLNLMFLLLTFNMLMLADLEL